MVACKILLICLAVVAINVRFSQSHYSPALTDCACFPRNKGRVRISNLADKHGKHERIVVYIFKHPETRKVTVYVPSEEKQIKFPDLTVTNLETYSDYTIENLYQIINKPKIPIRDSSHPILSHVINLEIPDDHVLSHLQKHEPVSIPHNNLNLVDVPDNIHIELDLNNPEVNTIKGPTNVNIKPTIGEEMLDLNNDNVMPSSVSLKEVNNPVFNRWLLQEIKNVGTTTYNTMEMDRIKIRLILVLEQSGLRFYETGDLIDKNGQVIKISNLKLRRVMISDPVVYKKLGGECVPRGIPYLEAVFVSLVYPPTVLGVIPLRMTSLPRCKKGKCRKCAAKKNHNFIMGPRYPQKLNLTPTRVNKNENIVLFSNGHTGLNKNEIVVLSSNGHTGLNKNEKVLPPLLHTGVVKNEAVLLSSKVHNNKIISPSPVHLGADKNEDILPTRILTGKHNGHNHESDVKTIHEHDNDDELGIRIIGGRPATSSGTPVSSKGRS